MVGELVVAIAGREATMLFLNDHVLIRFTDSRTALSIVNQAMPHPELVGKTLSFLEIGLKFQIGDRRAIELFPHPHLFLRWLSPAVRKLVQKPND